MHPDKEVRLELPDEHEDSNDDVAKDDDSFVQPVPEELKVETAIYSGYLNKRNEKRGWKKRFFVLRPTRLSYYKDQQEYELLNMIRLDAIHAVAPVQSKRRPYVFGLVTTDRTYYLDAGSEQQLNEWITLLKVAKSNLDVAHADKEQRNPHAIVTSSSFREAYPSRISAGEVNSPGIESDNDEFHIVTEEQLKDRILHQGYLFRLRGIAKVWKKYWCVVRTRSITLYKDDKVPGLIRSMKHYG